MTAQLRYAVYLDDPEQPGEVVRFLPGDEVPEWAQKEITNPNAWVDGVLPEKPKTTRAKKV